MHPHERYTDSWRALTASGSPQSDHSESCDHLCKGPCVIQREFSCSLCDLAKKKNLQTPLASETPRHAKRGHDGQAPCGGRFHRIRKAPPNPLLPADTVRARTAKTARRAPPSVPESHRVPPACRLFAGTPEFARASLQALVNSGTQPVAVLTQPDRPAGRGKKLTQSLVKQFAIKRQQHEPARRSARRPK